MFVSTLFHTGFKCKTSWLIGPSYSGLKNLEEQRRDSVERSDRLLLTLPGSQVRTLYRPPKTLS